MCSAIYIDDKFNAGVNQVGLVLSPFGTMIGQQCMFHIDELNQFEVKLK